MRQRSRSRVHWNGRRKADVVSVVGVAIGAIPSSASATPTMANCYGLHAPTSHSSESCNDVCTLEDVGGFGYQVNCYVDVYTYTDGDITAVLDYEDAGNTVYSAWGNDTAGDDFCCAIHDSADEVWIFNLTGSYISDDDLAFQYSTHSMGTPDGFSFLARAYGSDGADVIVGSPESDTDYKESLLGSYVADFIYGDDGDDYICGGGGSGASNADFLAGEGGDDVVIALFGGNSLRGGGGTNVLCGFATDSSANTFYGTATGVSVFFQKYYAYGATPSGILFGGTGFCGHPAWGSSWATGCTYNGSSVPSECSDWADCSG